MSVDLTTEIGVTVTLPGGGDGGSSTRRPHTTRRHGSSTRRPGSSTTTTTTSTTRRPSSTRKGTHTVINFPGIPGLNKPPEHIVLGGSLGTVTLDKNATGAGSLTIDKPNKLDTLHLRSLPNWLPWGSSSNDEVVEVVSASPAQTYETVPVQEVATPVREVVREEVVPVREVYEEVAVRPVRKRCQKPRPTVVVEQAAVARPVLVAPAHQPCTSQCGHSVKEVIPVRQVVEEVVARPIRKRCRLPRPAVVVEPVAVAKPVVVAPIRRQ